MATKNELYDQLNELWEQFQENHRAHAEKGNKAAGTSNFDQLKPRMLTSTNLGLSAAIIASSNPSVEITRTSCMTIGNVEIECTPDTTQANGWAATEMQCYQTDPAQCSTEIYTLKTILLDSSGSQHVMQSRYAVRCDS